MDIFDQIEQPAGRARGPNPYTVSDMGEVVDTRQAAPKGDIFDQVAPRGLSKYNGLLGGDKAEIKSAPGFLNNLSQALTAPFHQERAPIAADQPRPEMFGRALESAAAAGKGILGLLNAPFETVAPTVTKYAGENLPITPQHAEAIGNAVGAVAQGSILPWRSRTPLTPARNIEDLIAAPRPGLPAPAEPVALPPPAAQPRLNPPEMVTQVTPEGVASQAPKRTIIDLVDEVKRDVKQQVIDEIFQELKTGRPQAAAGAPKQAAPLSIEDLRGQLAPEAKAPAAPAAQPAMVTHVNSEGVATQAPIDEILQKLKTDRPQAAPAAPVEAPSMVKEAAPPTPTTEHPIFTSAKEPPEVNKQNPLPGERTAGDILKGESGALKIGRDKPPEVFGPPIEPPEVRGGVQSPKFDFSKWKDKAALSLSRETLERNIAKVAPAEDAAKVDSFIVQPVRQNETNRINYNNSLKTETRGAVVEKLGIKAGSKEDALTQAYGEGRLPLEELKTLTPNWQKVVSASDYFRGKYDKLLDTVNEARAKFGYEPIPKRADYFRHFQDIDNIIKNFGVILRTEDLPTEISGLTEGFKPGKPFSTAELQRKGGSYTMSAIKGFDNYIDSISKQIFHIDSVQRARGLENYIREAAGADNAKLPNLVANLHEYGNLLAGKKSTFDRAFESLFGRKFYSAVNVLRGRTSANMVGGNVGSALTNFIPFTQAAATTNKGSLAKGMLQATVAPFEKDPAAIDGIASSFLTRRYPEGAISPTIGENLKKGANFLFDAVDKFTARSVVGGKYYEGINNGLSPKEAMAAADTYAGKVLTDRSLGQLPNLFNVKTLGPITQFQTEINNAYSFMTKDIPALSGSKAKTIKALSEFVLYSYLFNSGFEKVTGRRPTIDPLHFLITLAGDGDVKQKLGTLNEDIVSNLPLVGGISGGRLPISAGMPDVVGMAKGEKGVGSELSKPLFFLAPPFGGLQAKKTIEGASAYNAGQVRSASGQKKLFDIEQSPENLVRSVLFGKYATPQAREYFDSGQLTPREKLLKDLGIKSENDRNKQRKEILGKLGLDR